MKLKLKKSWRTTALGIVAGLGMLLDQVQYLLDSNPATQLDPMVVLTALALMGIGFVARDEKVTSEEAGAR